MKGLCQVLGQVAKLPRYQWAGCQQRRQQGLIWLLPAPHSDSNIFHFVLLQQIVLVSTLHASKIGGQNLEIKFNELGPQRFESLLERDQISSQVALTAQPLSAHESLEPNKFDLLPLPNLPPAWKQIPTQMPVCICMQLKTIYT